MDEMFVGVYKINYISLMKVIRFKSIKGVREQAVYTHLLENVEIKFSSGSWTWLLSRLTFHGERNMH